MIITGTATPVSKRDLTKDLPASSTLRRHEWDQAYGGGWVPALWQVVWDVKLTNTDAPNSTRVIGTMDVEFRTGNGIKEFTLADVVCSMVLDAQGFENSMTPGEMAREYGIEDVDYANLLWSKLIDHAKKMRRFLGADYSRFVQMTDPETQVRAECEKLTIVVPTRWRHWAGRNA